ncbi:coproporphyrinogen III oxidase [Rhodobacterales bacterium HKCCE2091]|nr:coproporphyrinogen III oxidase [Rhodobacterales bacterium HKCCE2091]
MPCASSRPFLEPEADRFGIYVHWPFCQAKCPYCDFNSHVAARIDQRRWAAAYRAEIARARAELGSRRVDTVFFGGGTPSLMDPDLVEEILTAIRAAWPVSNDFEVTMEANPTSVEAGRFRGYREAGVSRISVGLQSLDDASLKALGRLHSAAEGIRALDLARSVFDRVSCDLIYARQDQSLDQWKAELATAIALGTDHMSLYQLTIEDGTAFGDRLRAGRLRGLPGEDLSADLYDATQEMMEAAGLPAYEVSNHARPGSECRHNLIYWRGQEYLGVGPGAHGRIRPAGVWLATEGAKAPGDWLRRVEEDGSGELPRETLNARDRGVEYLLMSLRLDEGSALARLGDEVLDRRAVEELCDSGHLWTRDGRIGATKTGRPVLNAVLEQLLA